MNHYISTKEKIGKHSLHIIAKTDDECNISNLRYFLSNTYISTPIDTEALSEAIKNSLDGHVTDYFNQYKKLI